MMFTLLTLEETFILVTVRLRGRAAQTIMCRIADACLTADTILRVDLAWFHTSWRFDLGIISTAILLPSADSRRVVRDVKHQNKQTKVCLNSLYPENADGSLISYL